MSENYYSRDKTGKLIKSPVSFKERFDNRIMIEPNTGCWLWTAGATALGYGVIWNPETNKLVLAHRVAWELYVGPIPDGMELCHTCDTPACCSPYHHFLGTHAENFRDAARKHRMRPGLPDNSGMKNGQAKLTDSQVMAIRADNRPKTVIASEYKTSLTTIKRIKAHTIWKHI